jgi:hypothetical protein
VAVLVGSDLTNEEAKLVQGFVSSSLSGASLSHFGTPGVKSTADDAPLDKILKRKSKTSNLNGLEKLGIKGFDGLPSGTDAVLVIRGGRAVLPDLKGASTVVGVGVFTQAQIAKFHSVLPGTAFAEKDGTIANYENREQKLRKSVNAPGQSKQLSEILSIWTGKASGKSSGAGAA